MAKLTTIGIITAAVPVLLKNAPIKDVTIMIMITIGLVNPDNASSAVRMSPSINAGSACRTDMKHAVRFLRCQAIIEVRVRVNDNINYNNFKRCL